jgi:hypothetical protein
MRPKLRIISGGQTGADIGGLRAAKAAGLETGGWMPKGWLTEEGSHPEYAELYGLEQLQTKGYPARTHENVRRSRCLVWFGCHTSPGGILTIRSAKALLLPVCVSPINPSYLAGWLKGLCDGKGIVWSEFPFMVAGNRESRSPGIAARVEAFMTEVFSLLED